MPKTKAQKKKTMSKSARRRQSRQARKINDPRWGFSLSDLSVGPVKLGKVDLNSRSMSSRLVPPSDTVGVAPYALKVQTVMPRITTRLGGKFGATDVLMGTEYLQSVSSSEVGNQPGDLLLRLLINPSSFNDTRLYQFANLYQRYRFTRLNFIYEPIASAITSGQVIGFADFDVDNLLQNDSGDNISIAAAHIGQANNQVWQHMVYPFGVADDFSTLFTSLTTAEARLIYQGVFYLIASSSIPSPAGEPVPLGNIYVDYEVEFNIPQLSQLGVRPLENYCHFDAGASAGFTSDLPYGATNLNSSENSVFPDLDGESEYLSGTYNGTTGVFVVNDIPGGYYVLSMNNAARISPGGASIVSITTVLNLLTAGSDKESLTGASPILRVDPGAATSGVLANTNFSDVYVVEVPTGGIFSFSYEIIPTNSPTVDVGSAYGPVTVDMVSIGSLAPLLLSKGFRSKTIKPLKIVDGILHEVKQQRPKKDKGKDPLFKKTSFSEERKEEEEQDKKVVNPRDLPNSTYSAPRFGKLDSERDYVRLIEDMSTVRRDLERFIEHTCGSALRTSSAGSGGINPPPVSRTDD